MTTTRARKARATAAIGAVIVGGPSQIIDPNNPHIAVGADVKGVN